MKINEFSPLQFLVLCIISSQERANKHKQAKKIYLKSKLNQVSVIALPDSQFLRQVSENAILHPIIC